MPSLNENPPIDNGDTCSASDPACTSAEKPQLKQPAQPEQSTPEQPTQQTEQPTEPEQPQTGESDGTEGIRTTPIPMPGMAKQAAPVNNNRPQQSAPQARPQGGGGPGMRNLVRFLNNPAGAMQSNSSDYLNTMLSSDSADLVLRSAINSGSGFY